jgi:hypothetical protein
MLFVLSFWKSSGCFEISVVKWLALLVSGSLNLSQDAKVYLKILIVAIIQIYSLSETINLFFFLFLRFFKKLILFSASLIFLMLAFYILEDCL